MGVRGRAKGKILKTSERLQRESAGFYWSSLPICESLTASFNGSEVAVLPHDARTMKGEEGEKVRREARKLDQEVDMEAQLYERYRPIRARVLILVVRQSKQPPRESGVGWKTGPRLLDSSLRQMLAIRRNARLRCLVSLTSYLRDDFRQMGSLDYALPRTMTDKEVSGHVPQCFIISGWHRECSWLPTPVGFADSDWGGGPEAKSVWQSLISRT